VLRKRAALREALRGFEPDVVAALDPADDVGPLLADARLIRSGPKLRACITNARATVALRAEGGLAALLWSRAEVPSAAYDRWEDVPATTGSATELARELKRRGFAFVGPTTVYSLMQACGLVGDHLTGCPVRAPAEAERATVHRP